MFNFIFDRDINASNNIMKFWTLGDQDRSRPKTFANTFVFDKEDNRLNKAFKQNLRMNFFYD